VSLDLGIIQKATERTLEAAFRLVHWRAVLLRGVKERPSRATPGHELLVTLLRDKEVHAVERLFRLLGLQFRGEDFRRIHRGLRNTNPKVRAGSRELLENLIEPPLRSLVLALVDDAPADERLARAGPHRSFAPLDYEALLPALLEEKSESIRSIAAYHVGELGLRPLRGRLEALAATESGYFVSQVIERALRMLPGPEGGPAHAR